MNNGTAGATAPFPPLVIGPNFPSGNHLQIVGDVVNQAFRGGMYGLSIPRRAR
jgi:hypothetical protein